MSKASDTVLLDTHVWIWLLSGGEQLRSSRCLRAIEKARRTSGIKVSAISVWEVGMLEARGRISFSIDCMDWVRKALAAPGISLAPVTPEIAVASSRLPGEFHGDPADRIIVATARTLGAILVTRDERILSYGRHKHVRTIRA